MTPFIPLNQYVDGRAVTITLPPENIAGMESVKEEFPEGKPLFLTKITLTTHDHEGHPDTIKVFEPMHEIQWLIGNRSKGASQ